MSTTQPSPDSGGARHSADSTPTQPATPGAAPLRRVPFGRYELRELLGHGATGVVYKAIDPRLNRPVAVKMLLDGADAPPAVAERFLLEARAAGQLRHPNVVAIYDYGREGGEPYFVMAYAAGGSLARHRYRFLNDSRAAVVLAEKVARAVQHAHEH